MKKTNNELFEKLNRVFTSNLIDINEKKNLMNLKKIYISNLKLDNIEELENRLYSNKTKEEKIFFEIDRIKKKLSEDTKVKNKNYNNILNYLENILKNSEKNEQIYDDLFKNIIQIEWELGM